MENGMQNTQHQRAAYSMRRSVLVFDCGEQLRQVALFVQANG